MVEKLLLKIILGRKRGLANNERKYLNCLDNVDESRLDLVIRGEGIHGQGLSSNL